MQLQSRPLQLHYYSCWLCGDVGYFVQFSLLGLKLTKSWFSHRWVCWLTRWRRRERRLEIWTFAWMSTEISSTPQRRCCSRCVCVKTQTRHRRTKQVLLFLSESIPICRRRSFCAELHWRRRNWSWCLKCPTSSWNSTLWRRRDWTLTDLGTARSVRYL